MSLRSNQSNEQILVTLIWLRCHLVTHLVTLIWLLSFGHVVVIWLLIWSLLFGY